ncbi:MAG TPA: hypothetical protein VFJ84_03625 [Candidatus Saccharimonadales bacterium]|nr:hypothetical protein [Candidatus Saccharimonadales bacterium]
MHKACEQAVEKLGKSLCKAAGLYTKSTTYPKYLTSQVFVMPVLSTAFEQMMCAYKQAVLAKSRLLDGVLSPFYTPSINTTNLIKE